MTLPGLAIAGDYLSSEREMAQDIASLLENMDHPPTAPILTEITPDRACDALMILRLFKGHADVGAPHMLPAPGAITLIRAALPSDTIRLKTLFKMLNATLVPQGARCRTLVSRLNLIRLPGSEVSRAGDAQFREQVETALLNGDPVMLFTAGSSPICAELRSLIDVSVTIAPTDAPMLAAILAILHKTPVEVSALPHQGISGLGELQLARVFAAQTADAAIAQLHKLCQHAQYDSHITLDSVHGQREAKEAFVQLLQDMEDWRQGRIAWSEVTSSFLLFGPPGTGKTHLASALAGSAQLTFIKTSYSDCQKAGHQGDMLRELHAAADKACTNAPSVFFLDEIDSFHARTRPSSSNYILGVVNGLLTLLDKLNQTEGVIVIAATNHPETVDPAILRAGRFDQHIPVGPLDRAGVVSFLKQEVPAGLLRPSDLNRLSDQLSGQVGATLANLVRSARTKARRERTDLRTDHLIGAADALAPAPTPDLMHRVAVHEAGHLLIGHLCGLPHPRGAELNGNGGFVEMPKMEYLTSKRVDALITVDLAGRAAEMVMFGTACHGSGGNHHDSDLARATRRAMEAELSYGFGATLIWHPLPDDISRLSPELCARVEDRLQRARAYAQVLLQNHQANLERIAATLLQARRLNAAQIVTLLDNIDARHPKLHQDARL
ncbi:ATP-dependent Zn protease [Roseinatronobacter thiooxidans]|uniref:ATP-dependent Zn protease n=1 Tax=Roseinatronobacter thiooxidans TaxID=121821 RepID=A0A2W7PNX8_9RHOB|nr:AAA family ATPase [Roseinatronobacter thiooxidans]PZX37964.1 ATP-dependent Zn protease [Roseinatronobacter thiooxidans]